MQDLHIQATEHTPEIDFNFKSGLLTFRGKSYPENTFAFYKPVQEWLEEFLDKSKNKDIVVHMDINYLNSSSTKTYYDIFDTLDNNQNNNIKVEWEYDEEDDMTFETGEEFQEDYTELNFEFIVKDS